ncbi:hypothetical protein [Colwellia psychrerythraea]|uniref:Uncharacterized protein n=1 Tax=Colwellia psychrerythraea TaxID=28229 RepID=A0A099KRD8_COLPS|nr:hypothetical protein [Colwellia psychrerythraea]KGJ93324.1 hypothetical protein GAB14E_2648 [Colwellia psychrerythraea]
MFNLLSSQTRMLILLSKYSSQELQIVCNNLKMTIKLLNLSTTELLENRRNYGVLLPQVEVLTEDLDAVNLQALNYEQTLLNPNTLIKVLNTFCLTEAVIVRNNFNNCLDFVAEQSLATVPIIKIDKPQLSANVGKSNVSPIRLTEIKQRLSQAVKSPTDKQVQIKNKLNNLLTQPTTTSSTGANKQA